MILNPKQEAEIGFWKSLKAQHGDSYADFRHAEYRDKTKYFPDFFSQKGVGLDLGCGLVSVLEASDKDCYFMDPLMEEYRKIEKLSGKYLDQPDFDKIPYADSSLDWIFCVNVIDHTPDAGKLIDEMKRVLKSDGMLYFEVHFDPALYAPHYHLWNMETVQDHFYSKFLLKYGQVVYHPEWSKDCYYGEFINKK